MSSGTQNGIRWVCSGTPITPCWDLSFRDIAKICHCIGVGVQRKCHLCESPQPTPASLHCQDEEHHHRGFADGSSSHGAGGWHMWMLENGLHDEKVQLCWGFHFACNASVQVLLMA